MCTGAYAVDALGTPAHPLHAYPPTPTPAAPPCSKFQTRGPFWGREYIFWHGGRPLTVIYEVFSSALEEFLGPALAAEAP